jgi:hypothetical protein
MNILLFSMPDSFEHMPTIAVRNFSPRYFPLLRTE